MTTVAGSSGSPSDPDDGARGGERFHVVSLRLRATDRLDLARAVREGIPYGRLRALQGELGLGNEEMADAVGVSPRTLTRRREEGRLHEEESDRLVRLGLLFDEAVRLFEGDAAAARDWFRRPNRALGDETPLEAAGTFVGAREVENLIGRLEHGVVA